MKPYPLMVDTRVESSSAAMIQDLEKGEIDVALLWGPIAGYYAKTIELKLECDAAAGDARRPHGLPDRFRGAPLRSELEARTQSLIAQNKIELERILRDYGVPMLDESGHAITVP